MNLFDFSRAPFFLGVFVQFSLNTVALELMSAQFPPLILM